MPCYPFRPSQPGGRIASRTSNALSRKTCACRRRAGLQAGCRRVSFRIVGPTVFSPRSDPPMFQLCRPVLAVVFLTAAAPAADAPPVPLMKGDRIVFLGDSITAGRRRPQGLRHPHQRTPCRRSTRTWASRSSAPASAATRCPTCRRRLEKDVLAKKPTVVVIYIGINDVWHGEKDPAKGTSKDKYEAGLREVIRQMPGRRRPRRPLHAERHRREERRLQRQRPQARRVRGHQPGGGQGPEGAGLRPAQGYFRTTKRSTTRTTRRAAS